jgi:hypothetical protein
MEGGTSYIDHANIELPDPIKDPDGDDGIQGLVNQNIIDLLKVFALQGHSGTTAPYVIRRFARLASWNVLRPLTGDDDEWSDVLWDDGRNLQQNKRYSAVFREKFDNSSAYDIEGKVFSDDGVCWYTNGGSHTPVTFPYLPPDEPERILRKISGDLGV